MYGCRDHVCLFFQAILCSCWQPYLSETVSNGIAKRKRKRPQERFFSSLRTASPRIDVSPAVVIREPFLQAFARAREHCWITARQRQTFCGWLRSIDGAVNTDALPSSPLLLWSACVSGLSSPSVPPPCAAAVTRRRCAAMTSGEGCPPQKRRREASAAPRPSAQPCSTSSSVHARGAADRSTQLASVTSW